MDETPTAATIQLSRDELLLTCVFRPMTISDSGLCRSQIPADVDQPFWSMPISHSGQAVA